MTGLFRPASGPNARSVVLAELARLWDQAVHRRENGRPHITQKWLSAESRVPLSTVNGWATGRALPRDLDQLTDVGRVLARWAGEPPRNQREWGKLQAADQGLAAGVKSPRKSPPGGGRRSEPDYWATIRIIHDRTASLIGREQELAGIASFAAGTEGYRWFVGAPWSGKTSLLAKAVTALQGEVDVVSYFLSRREADADRQGFLNAVVPQLEYLLGEDLQSRELHRFYSLWESAANRASVQGRHLLLVVDGLDEDVSPPASPSVAALVPEHAGDCVHVLVSSRRPELLRDMPPRHPLTGAKQVELQPFMGAETLSDPIPRIAR